MDRKRLLIFFLKCSVTLGLILFLLSRVEFGESIRILKSARIGLTLIAFVLMSFNFLAASLILNQIVHAVKDEGRYLKTLKINYITQFFVFSGLGELFGSAVKFKYLDQITDRSRLSTAEKVAIILFEKLATVSVTLLLASLFALLLFSDMRPLLAAFSFNLGALYVSMILIALAGVLLTVLKRKSGHIFRPLHDVIKVFGRNSALLVKLFFAAGFIYCNNIIINYIVFQAADAHGVTLSNVIVLYFFIFLVQFLPISIGGLGVKENIVVFVMVFYNLTPEQSVAYSLICLILTMIHSLLGGTLALVDHYKNLGNRLFMPTDP